MSKRVRASLLAIVLLVAFVVNGTMAVFANSTPLQITEQPTDAFGKIGEYVSTSLTAEGYGLTYQWFYKNPNMTGYAKSRVAMDTYTFALTEANDGRKAYCIVTDAYGDTVISDIVTFRVSTLKITAQPTNTAGALGETVSTSVTATGEELSYQWYEKDAGAADFVASATGDTYSHVLTETAREVYCVITDKYGDTKTTKTVTLKVGSAVAITKQPVNAVGKVGSTLSATVTAEGDGLKYQWYIKSPGAASFSKSSITSASYYFQMTEDKVGRQAYCVVTDTYGNSVTSDTVVFSIPTPVAIVEQPTDALAPAGKVAATTVVATGDGLTYKWYIKDAGDADFKVSSIGVATYSFEMTEEKNGRQAYCVVTDKYGDSATSDTVVFTIPESVAIVEQPTDTLAPIGKATAATVTATGEGLTYKWYIKDAGDADFKASSIGVATYSFEMTEEKDGRQAYCVVADKYGNTAVSDTVTFTVPQLTIVKQPTNDYATIGNLVDTTVVAEGYGLTYQWFYKNADDETFSASSIRAATYSYEMSADKADRLVYCVVTDMFGTTVTTDTVELSTPKAVTIVTQPTGGYVLIGKEANAQVVAKGDGLAYQWYIKNADDADFKLSSVQVPTYAYVMDVAKSGRQVYCVVTDMYGNEVVSDVVTFLISDLAITEQPVGDAGLIGDTLTATIAADGEELTYQWYVNDEPVADATGTSYSVELVEGAVDCEVYCVVTDVYGNYKKSDTVVFGVGGVVINDQPVDVLDYAGNIATFSVAAEGKELSYQWYANGEPVVGATDSTYEVEIAKALDGTEIYCVVTDAYGFSATSDIAVLNTYVYTITLDLGDGNVDTIDNITADGAYTLEAPEREGYTFLGWVDGEGNPVESTGTVNGDVTFYATWESLSNDALANTKYLLENGEINVAYLGGSITGGYGSTSGNSWRELTSAWLGETYPDATINEINVARGGTGTYFAKHRIDSELLTKNPDLLFVEFVVNDKLERTTAAQSAANMETIVRKALTHNPNMDIVFVYTTCVSMGTAKENTWINAFNTVAEHYGIEVIYAGAAMGEYEGELTDLFLTDEVHPNDDGYAVLAGEVIENVGSLLTQAGDEVTELAAHEIPDALTANLNLNTKVYTAVKLLQQNPTLSIGSQSFVSYVKDCLVVPAGESFTFTFYGDSVGIYWYSKTSGGVEITSTLDGESTIVKKAPNNSNGISYELFSGLDMTVAHTLTLTNTGDANLLIPMIFTTDATPTQQTIDGISVPATGYSPKFEDRIEIGAVSLTGLDLSIEIKNISPKWDTGDGDSYFEYTCYDAEGNELTVGTINFGYIKTNSGKTFTITLPEGTASVVLTDFAATFWTPLV